jgi:type IV pilus assembly protein PilM
MEGNNPVNPDKSILGIHIDGDCLNIVHLEQTTEGVELLHRTHEPLQDGIINDGLIIDTQAVSQKIRDFVQTNQIKTRKAVISLPCSAVRLKPCEFPAQTYKKLQEQVEEQIGKYSLFGGREVVFDYCTFEGKIRSTNKQTVLQAITSREISDAYLEIVNSVGLKLVGIEPAVLAIIKFSFNKQSTGSQAVSLLLVLDSVSANLSVFNKGLPQFCQNLNIGIKDLSQDKNGFSHLSEQIKSVLNFAHSLDETQQPAFILAANCDGEMMDTIVSQIKKDLNDVTIQIIDQNNIAKRFNVQGSDEKEVTLFAFASALTSFGVCEYDGQLNLVSQQSMNIHKTQKEISYTAKIIIALFLLSVATLVPLKMKIKSVEADLTNVAKKVTETIPIRDKIFNLKKQMQQVNSKLSAYIDAEKKLTNLPWPRVLSVIGDKVPGRVRISEISTTDTGEFNLFGKALAESYVHTFAKKLQNEELVEYAEVEEIEYDENRNSAIVDYKISCHIRLPESNL